MHQPVDHFSALQRAEIAEMSGSSRARIDAANFSALQRAEIAEIGYKYTDLIIDTQISVLFNEPKLLKSPGWISSRRRSTNFSALQRAEIAEICTEEARAARREQFQCSSTSRNC